MCEISWIKQFKVNSNFGNLRFKKLDLGFGGYPKFEFVDDLLDIVDLDTFVRIEEERIPLFIGTQFGISPDPDKIPDFCREDRIIALLPKSALSGKTLGLVFYKITKRKELLDYQEFPID